MEWWDKNGWHICSKIGTNAILIAYKIKFTKIASTALEHIKLC